LIDINAGSLTRGSILLDVPPDGSKAYALVQGLLDLVQ